MTPLFPHSLNRRGSSLKTMTMLMILRSGDDSPLRGEFISYSPPIFQPPEEFRVRANPNPTLVFCVTVEVPSIETTSTTATSHPYLTRSKGSRVFNISVKKALQIMPDAAVKSMYQEIAQLHAKQVFEGIVPGIRPRSKVLCS